MSQAVKSTQIKNSDEKIIILNFPTIIFWKNGFLSTTMNQNIEEIKQKQRFY